MSRPFVCLLALFAITACQGKSLTPTPTLTPLRAEIVQENTGFVVDMDFSPDGRLFYTTQEGDVYTQSIPASAAFPAPTRLLSLNVARATSFESGLLALALSPTFADDHTFYVYYTVPDANNAPLASRLARYIEQDGKTSAETILLDLPARPDQQYHFGGALNFGPDGKLYLIFGDTNLPDEARNPQSPYGSVLRINPDGSVPADNPFPGSYVYAYGVRNGFGLAWQPGTGVLYETENGADCDDEFNRIERGQDYGWGLYPYDTCPYPDDATPPLYQWTPTAAPATLLFYQGTRIPEWDGKVLICGFNRQELYVVTLTQGGRSVQTLEQAHLPGLDFPCRVALVEGPDGWVYASGEASIFRIGR